MTRITWFPLEHLGRCRLFRNLVWPMQNDCPKVGVNEQRNGRQSCVPQGLFFFVITTCLLEEGLESDSATDTVPVPILYMYSVVFIRMNPICCKNSSRSTLTNLTTSPPSKKSRPCQLSPSSKMAKSLSRLLGLTSRRFVRQSRNTCNFLCSISVI